MKVVYLATPAINYRYYGKPSVCVCSFYVRKICEDKFISCKKLFSWVGQKVNKKNDAYGLWPQC